MIHHIGWLLQPFMPETSAKIMEITGDNNKEKDITDNKFRINKGKPLFPRII
jgi:methionyl-tRNA synthetase